MKVLETERLHLRPFQIGDLDAIYRAVYSDPDVCRFFCGETRTLERTERWLHFRSYEAETEDFGLLAVVPKETGAVIGLCGLQPYVSRWAVYESTPEVMRRFNTIEVELTYAFGKSAWGKGYAYEACLPLIDYAFSDLRLWRLVTACDRENSRARKLQDRLGMIQERNLHPDWPDDTEGVLYNDRV